MNSSLSLSIRGGEDETEFGGGQESEKRLCRLGDIGCPVLLQYTVIDSTCIPVAILEDDVVCGCTLGANSAIESFGLRSNTRSPLSLSVMSGASMLSNFAKEIVSQAGLDDDLIENPDADVRELTKEDEARLDAGGGREPVVGGSSL